MEQYAEFAGISVDYLDLYDQVLSYKKDPINLNASNYAELSSFALIGKTRANLILQHRKNYGKFISIYELQSIPTFTSSYISLILPYVSIADRSLGSFGDQLKEGRHELMVLSQYSDISHLQPVNPTDSNRI